MSRKLNLVNERYGRLIVIKSAPNKIHPSGRESTSWLCKCDCGNTIVVLTTSLRNNNTMSCGCLREYNTIISNKFHGMKNTPEYNSWISMKSRCINKNNNMYHHYGGRGIKVCDRWLESFENFYEDMGDRPEETSLDRINNNGDYEPKNCRWATLEEQSRNKSTNFNIKYNNEIRSLIEWCETLNLNYSAVYARLKSGWSVKNAFEKPFRDIGQTLSYNNRTQLITEWAKETGLKPNIIRERIKRGWSIEKVLNTKINGSCKTITFEGETLSISEWGEKLNLSTSVINQRLRLGWSIEKIFNTHVRTRN